MNFIFDIVEIISINLVEIYIIIKTTNIIFLIKYITFCKKVNNKFYSALLYLCIKDILV